MGNDAVDSAPRARTGHRGAQPTRPREHANSGAHRRVDGHARDGTGFAHSLLALRGPTPLYPLHLAGPLSNGDDDGFGHAERDADAFSPLSVATPPFVS